MDSGWKSLTRRIQHKTVEQYYLCDQCWENNPTEPNDELTIIDVQDFYQRSTDECGRCGRHPS